MTTDARRSVLSGYSGGRRGVWALVRLAPLVACLWSLAASGGGANPGADARADAPTDAASSEGGAVTMCPPGQSLCSGACVADRRARDALRNGRGRDV